MTYSDSPAAGVGNKVSYNVAVVNVVFKMYSQVSGRLKAAIYKVHIMSGGDMNRSRCNIEGAVKVIVPEEIGELCVDGAALSGCIAVRAVQLV